MERNTRGWKKNFVNIDQYVSAVIFIVIMFLLFLQVVSVMCFTILLPGQRNCPYCCSCG